VVSAPDGTVLATAPLSFAQAVTGPAQPAVAVTPASGLHDGDTVVVTATGFPPYTPVTVDECSPVPSGSGYQYGNGCGFTNGPGLVLTTDQDGALGPVTLPVHVLAYTDFDSSGVVALSCPPSPSQQEAGIGACVIEVSAANGITSGAAAPIAFAAGVSPPTPPAAPQVTSPVVIDQIVNPGDLTPGTGEHVVLRNTDPQNTATVSNWSIEDLAGNLLLIGPDYTIPPGGTLSVYTGSGTDTPRSYYNGITVALLNQPVEELTLLNESGQPVGWYTDVAAPT
jgi:hypothetical protein